MILELMGPNPGQVELAVHSAYYVALEPKAVHSAYYVGLEPKIYDYFSKSHLHKYSLY